MSDQTSNHIQTAINIVLAISIIGIIKVIILTITRITSKIIIEKIKIITIRGTRSNENENGYHNDLITRNKN